MKTNNILFALIIVLTGTSLFGQKDPKATEILNKVSTKSTTHKTIDLTFTYAIKSGDVNDKQSGTVLIKGDQYKYSLFGVTKVCDGKSISTISPDDEEIIITDANFNDADEFSPQEMFSIYKKGYKYRYIKEITNGALSLHVIDLYPDSGNKAPYRRVTLYINKATNEISKIELFHKTSSKIFTISVDSVKYNTPVPDSTFVCNCSTYPDFDCDDQRGSK